MTLLIQRCKKPTAVLKNEPANRQLAAAESTAQQEGTGHPKSGPPIFSSPGPKYIKIFGPPDNLFQFC